MKTCQECARLVDDEDVFCRYCGDLLPDLHLVRRRVQEPTTHTGDGSEDVPPPARHGMLLPGQAMVGALVTVALVAVVLLSWGLLVNSPGMRAVALPTSQALHTITPGDGSTSGASTGGEAGPGIAPASTSTQAPVPPRAEGRAREEGRPTHECGRDGAGSYAAVGTGNATTSCAFALSVRRAYLEARLDGATGTISAYSPTSGRRHRLTCSGAEPVRCSGGDAQVLVYGGELE